MHWVSILFIAFASNLDNLGIGISLGVRSTKIPALFNAMIAVITMMGTYLSMTMGELMSSYISDTVANWLGASIISAIGIWTIISPLCQKTPRPAITDSDELVPSIHNPSVADQDDDNQVISFKETCMLGLALALNNIATGLGAGATGVSPLWTTLAAGVFSFLFIDMGSRTGLKLAGTLFGRYSNGIAGMLFIIIGIYEMFA